MNSQRLPLTEKKSHFVCFFNSFLICWCPNNDSVHSYLKKSYCQTIPQKTFLNHTLAIRQKLLPSSKIYCGLTCSHEVFFFPLYRFNSHSYIQKNYQTSTKIEHSAKIVKMKCFSKIVSGFQLLTTFAKRSIVTAFVKCPMLDV